MKLSLEPMELGLCEKAPFAGQPSWTERMLRLRDKLGPFRLAYLEAVLRAADMRASTSAAANSDPLSAVDAAPATAAGCSTTNAETAAASFREQPAIADPSYLMSHQALDDLALLYFRAIAEKIRRDPSL